MSVFDDIKEKVNRLFTKDENEYQKSTKWKEYHLGATISHCLTCFERDHKIYLTTDIPSLPEHEHCLCYLDWLKKVSIGHATNLGEKGADYSLAYFDKLPNYYITKEQAYKYGWDPIKGNLGDVAPGKMIGGNVFSNREKKLPNAEGRVWYECDIEYSGGYRNGFRLIYSNDGLIFKTDSHYTEFIAVE